MTRVLVIEQDDSRRRQLREEFERNGFDIVEAHDADAASVGPIQADAVVADASLVTDSVNVISLAAPTPVVLVADSPSISQAVECMRQGAADYLARPLQPASLIAAVERAAAHTHSPVATSTAFAPIIGQCPAMLDLLKRVATVAPTDSTVLIQGESGTGKELIARALHVASRRCNAQLISFNCAATPETLIETELFGRDGARSPSDGADTPLRGLLEAAHAGTLFLDEIGDLPAGAQARLLQFLEEGTIRRLGSSQTHRVDARVIAATHRDLQQLTDNRRFRADLLFRLNAVSLRVPALRERGEDVIAIAHALLERLAGKLNKRGLSFSPEALDAMRRYRWPGNVRELENALERAVILCRTGYIDADMLPIHTGSAGTTLTDPPGEASSSLEGYFLRFVLDNEHQLTETELASKLGISRKSLWERRQRLNIPRRRTHKRGPRRDQR